MMYFLNWPAGQNAKLTDMRQFMAFVTKEFYHVFRDGKTLLLLIGMPIAQIVLFGFALTNEIKDSHIVVCDYAHDDASQDLIGKFKASDNFVIEESLMTHEEIDAAFKRGKVKLAIVLPAHFSDDLQHQHSAQVQLIADASDPNTATTLTGYATQIILEYQHELLGGQQLPYTINTETRMIYNPELRGATNFVPGVMALVLLLVCVLMTSVSIVKEKELGTMEILLVSPFKPIMVIIAKAVPYLVLSLGNLVIILLLSVFLLHIPIEGNIFLLFFESTLLILTALSMGLMISNVTNSQQTAMLLSLMGMMLPTVLLSGFMFPVENMPWPLQLVSNIVPSKWYYIIVKDVMIKGLGIGAVWHETLILMGMTAFLLLVSISKFKDRLA